MVRGFVWLTVVLLLYVSVDFGFNEQRRRLFLAYKSFAACLHEIHAWFLMPTPSNSAVASFASSLLRFWRNPRSNDGHSAQTLSVTVS